MNNVRICLELELTGQAAQDCLDIGKDAFIEDVITINKAGYRPMDVTLVVDDNATQAVNSAFSQGFGRGYQACKNQKKHREESNGRS